MLKLRCASCEKLLRVADDKAGRKVRCPVCQSVNSAPLEPDVEELEEIEEEVRPKKKRPRFEDEDDRPRRKKRRRRQQQFEMDFSLADLIPITYEAQVNLGIGIGVLLNIIGGVLLRTKNEGGGMGFIMLSLIFWIWGCCAYAKNKGRSEWFGLLGLGGLIGLIVLVLLPRND